MRYSKILLAYNGSADGKHALLECADLAQFYGAETHLLAVASMPPSPFLTEGFVPEELLEEEKKRTQLLLDEGIKSLTDRGFKAAGHLAVGEPVEEILLEADAFHADLIAMATTDRSRRKSAIASSVRPSCTRTMPRLLRRGSIRPARSWLLYYPVR